MPPIDVCLCVYVWRVSVRSLALRLHKLSHELLESLTGTFFFLLRVFSFFFNYMLRVCACVQDDLRTAEV